MNQQQSTVAYLKNKTFNPETMSPEGYIKVAENRSIYGNYLDNAITYDPSKDKRSVYDVVYSDDHYDPWGKPGGGAPLFDNSTGRLKTKLEGRMQWNLDGQTPSARVRRVNVNHKLPPSLVPYRKTPNSLIKVPMSHEQTTHRQVFGGIDNNNNVPPSQTPEQYSNAMRANALNMSDNNFNYNQQTNIEREAEVRNLQKYLKSNNDTTSLAPHTSNYSNMWFGRSGGGAPTQDVRRKNLMDTLENRNNQLPPGMKVGAGYFYGQTSPRRALPHERFFEPDVY